MGLRIHGVGCCCPQCTAQAASGNVKDGARRCPRHSGIIGTVRYGRSIEALLEDLIGEICTQVSGGIKSHFDKRGVSPTLSIPMFIRGSNVSVRQTVLKPSLVLQLNDRKSELYVEFCIEKSQLAVAAA
ncbi:MAG: hypothetical protein HRU17_10625 [Polyangiaceae bacterium]|nr:hypothetical protein [Polyangiaceae bacterium]